jgi:hypothetical protein
VDVGVELRPLAEGLDHRHHPGAKALLLHGRRRHQLLDEVAVAPPTANDGAEVAGDRLDDAEGDLVPAVGEDSVDVIEESPGQLS